MNIRTENLTILFVDIAGFTAVTSQQTRVQNARLLDSFNKALLPLIKRFKGRVIKSIGDALLLTFRSPTDAMLCGMALQDSIHDWNLKVAENERMHIRVAASLGEVRVTKNDIFGEPVNVASRIESLTPADEIYLSEALYMAMNKAEVPVQEVGMRDLPGIANPVRIYSIPRFASTRLVPESVTPAEEGSEYLFPYGGMHHQFPDFSSSFQKRAFEVIAQTPMFCASQKKVVTFAVIVICAGILFIAWLKYSQLTDTAQTATVTTAVTAPAFLGSPAPVEQSSQPVVQATVVPTPEPAVKAQPTKIPQKSAAQKPQWNIIRAKEAYRAGRLSKAEYKAIVVNLETIYENRIRELKLAYKANKISRDTYETRVASAKRAFRGD